MKNLNKKIDLLNSLIKVRKKAKYKIEECKENIINELHWKSINDILKRNDYVFYGDIKSHDIVKKSNNRFLNRDINDLKFYKFKARSLMDNKSILIIYLLMQLETIYLFRLIRIGLIVELNVI